MTGAAAPRAARRRGRSWILLLAPMSTPRVGSSPHDRSETSISVLSVTLRGEATGSPLEFRGDAVATAKRDLKPGEMLDGEGGFTVWANAIPASKSLALSALPIGLAHNVKLKRAVTRNTVVSFDDVELTNDLDVVSLRREMEAQCRSS